MNNIDWRCCSCHHTFRGAEGRCPQCSHIINPLHEHRLAPKYSYLRWFIKEMKLAFNRGLPYIGKIFHT